MPQFLAKALAKKRKRKRKRKGITVVLLSAMLILALSSAAFALGGGNELEVSSLPLPGYLDEEQPNPFPDIPGPVHSVPGNQQPISSDGSGEPDEQQTVPSVPSEPQPLPSHNALLNNNDIRDLNEENPPSYGERFIAKIITNATNWLMHIFKLDDPMILIFGYDARADKSDSFLANGLYGSIISDPTQASQVVLGVFPGYYFKAIAFLYDGFTKLLPIPLVIALVVLAIIFMLTSGTVEGRGKIKEYAQAFIVALLSLRFGAYIWSAIISVIHFFIKLIWANMLKYGVTPNFFMNMIWGDGQAGFNAAMQFGSLPLGILLLLAALMVLALNYQYVMRLIIMGGLILLFPVVTTLSVFPPYRHALQVWMKEFVANALLPLAHALALGVFFMALQAPGMGESVAFWLMLAYLAGLPTITNLIRELLGLQGGFRGGAISAMAGATGASSLGSLGFMMLARRSGASRYTDGGSGGHDTGTSDESMSHGGGKLMGATSGVGKFAQGAFNTGSAIAGNRVIRALAGGAVKGTTIAAGGTYATMTGTNPAAGMMIGYGAGAKLSKAGGSLVNATGSGVQTVAQSISENHGVRAGLADATQRIKNQSLEEGNGLAQTVVGMQDKVNTAFRMAGHEGPFAAPSFVKENQLKIRETQSKMNELRPDMNFAKAQYEQSRSKYGDDFQTTIEHKEQYLGLKKAYSRHESDLNLAQTRLKTPSELKAHTERYSMSRGRA
ncbi:hypothetical protein [Desulfitobacterium chlororespirans]|uniref:TrbL/VirB6 plasmid conjugal transfer protein n=1 Tax=Desulfitobacterium chlororespirans DSM 11544 TaxID=1121395 RepID=A0A1M7T686_9FIRM|nr:hypothetical protein [Desulfitobacterium chlororespirans]SHN66271.1 hypothetical protein SAMN02745215_01644 [Desulfitobacterium chlororespirans DSM 11544]